MTAEETNPKPLGQSQSGHGTVAFSNPQEAQRLAAGGMGRFDGRRVSLEGCVGSLCWFVEIDGWGAVLEGRFFGSSLLSVGSSSPQDLEATWRSHVPTRIDPRCRQQLLRWSQEAFRLRQEVAKPHKTQVFRRLRIDSSETSQRRRDRRSHLPNFWSCWLSRHWELPVPGSHWLSGTSDLDGQLTENSEEPVFCLTDARWFSFFGAASDLGLPA